MTREEYEKNRAVVRLLVRTREDFQAMRKRMDNRIGRKADYRVVEDKETGEIHANGGTKQDIDERAFDPDDFSFFSSVANEARAQEHEIEKRLHAVLKRFPVYTDFLQGVKGVGDIAAGWIIAEYDIYIASTVSKLWQFTGLNPGMVQGKKRVEKDDGTFELVPTGKMVRGDRLTPGHVAPFNQRLRTAMVGVLADGFIKAQAPYALEYYYPYKHRLANSDQLTTEIRKGGEEVQVAWRDTKPAKRDRAAKRYMIKMFLIDLYVAWRSERGLPVRKPYHEEKLGHEHSA